MGGPSVVPKEFKDYSQTLILAAKQEVSDAEFKTKKAEEERNKLVEKRKKELEKDRKKALKQQKKMQEVMRKKLDDEKHKKVLADMGEEVKEGEEEEEKNEEDNRDEEEEDEKKDEEMKNAAELPPRVELSAEEKRQAFCKKQVPDLTTYNLNTAFVKFSVPEKDEGFDDIKFEWGKADKCEDYVRTWIQDRKLTTRVEDLTPSEWAINKFKEWQKALQVWHQKQNQYKAALSKNAADKAVMEAAKAAKKAAKEKAQQEAEAKKKAEEAATAAKAEAGGEE
jgi:membrane protein involved in colicin uptake